MKIDNYDDNFYNWLTGANQLSLFSTKEWEMMEKLHDLPRYSIDVLKAAKGFTVDLTADVTTLTLTPEEFVDYDFSEMYIYTVKPIRGISPDTFQPQYNVNVRYEKQ